MTDTGQKRTFHVSNAMSALPPKADIREQDVCFGPIGDIPEGGRQYRGASCPAATAHCWHRPQVDFSVSIELSLLDCDSQASATRFESLQRAAPRKTDPYVGVGSEADIS